MNDKMSNGMWSRSGAVKAKVTIAGRMTIAARVVIAAIWCLFLATTLSAQTATITGKLVDRVCSVEDAFQLQPATEKRCTLWIQASTPCPAGSTTCINPIYTVCCPNKPIDDRLLNTAYSTCSDPNALQIRHPTRNYIISAFLRTVDQQKDGCGQFVGFGFQW